MSDCRHLLLVLLREWKNRLQCCHGHLTIDANELTSRYCPECFEGNGKKQYDVDEVSEGTDNIVGYGFHRVMIIARQQPAAAGRVSREATACFDCNVSRFLHCLDLYTTDTGLQPLTENIVECILSYITK